nr:MAG TPA: hypothetical protein [Caudoviricetes sp.]
MKEGQSSNKAILPLYLVMSCWMKICIQSAI